MLVANGGNGMLDVVDAGTLEKVASVKIGDDADNVRGDSATRSVYVGYGSGALAIVDTTKWKVVAEIALGAHPESFQFDAKMTRAFVNRMSPPPPPPPSP